MKLYAISSFLILSVALVTATLEDDMASLEKDLSKAELIDELEKEFASASKDAHTKIEKKYREKFDAIVKKKADTERLLNQDINTLNQKNAHTKIEKKDQGQFDAIVKKKADIERPLNQDISKLNQKSDDKLDVLQLLVNAIHDSKVKNDATCKDVWRKEFCAKKRKLGYCTQPVHEDRMIANCASTCGHCMHNPPKCSLTKYGCCWDRTTTKQDDAGSNCPSKYIYVDTKGEVASIESPAYQPNEDGHCFQLWYHMHGKQDNKLSVFIEGSKGSEELALISSNDENKWFAAQVDIKSKESFKVRLAAKRASGGNIALDDFKMLTRPCNSPASCSFESDRCLWENSLDDDIDWILGNGKRRASDNAPIIDNTTRTPYGNFMCLDVEKLEKGVSKKARIESEGIKIDSPACLTFAYHMDIQRKGALNLYVKTGGESSDEKLIWSLKGFQWGGWGPAAAPIEVKKDFRLVFEGVYDGVVGNTIAIDDINFSNQGCSIQPEEAKPKS